MRYYWSFQSTQANFWTTSVYFQGAKVYFSNYTSVISKYKRILSKYKNNFQSTKVYFQTTKLYFQFTKADFQSTQVYFQSTKVDFHQTTKVYFKSALSKYKVTFRTLGTESLEPGTFLIPRFLGWEPVPSKREQNLTRRNPSNTFSCWILLECLKGLGRYALQSANVNGQSDVPN